MPCPSSLFNPPPPSHLTTMSLFSVPMSLFLVHFTGFCFALQTTNLSVHHGPSSLVILEFQILSPAQMRLLKICVHFWLCVLFSAWIVCLLSYPAEDLKNALSTKAARDVWLMFLPICRLSDLIILLAVIRELKANFSLPLPMRWRRIWTAARFSASEPHTLWIS